MLHTELAELHGLLLARDPRAPSELVKRLLAPLVLFVRGQLPSLTDPQDAEQACLDALLDYLQDPSDYNPAKARLTTYLWNKAYWKARKVATRNATRASCDGTFAEELRHVNQETGGEPTAPGDVYGGVLARQILDRHLDRIAVDEGDGLIFFMMADGETEEEGFLEVLGLEDNSDNRREVERRCERIRGRLRRLREKL